MTAEQEAAQARQQYRAVAQYLWEMIQKFSPETNDIIVPSAVSNPLWELAFLKVEVDGKIDPNLIRICACTRPEITDQEKKRLVRLLKGTNKSIVEAMAELKLDFPATYVELKIYDRIRWSNNLWNQVTEDTPESSFSRN